MERFLGLPELASEHGARLDHLTGLIHVLMAVLFVVWTAFFLFMLVRFRRGSHPRADYTGVRGKASTWAEAAVALAEVILLVGFSIPLYSERVDDLPPLDTAVKVRIVAEQFAWNVHYPGPDGVFGRSSIELVDTQTNPLGIDPEDPMGKDDITAINQLHLPVDEPVLITLSSKDVIHSFFLPEMRVKQDAIPGMEFPVWFVPTVTTEAMRARLGNDKFDYEIGCAQLCGIGHATMRGFVTVHTREGFDAWMAEQEAEKAAEGEEGGFWG